MLQTQHFDLAGLPLNRERRNRPDADRRVRQCERLARLFQLVQLLSGHGKWDAEGLARELECSQRTIYRFLQTLSFAGIPWYFDRQQNCYKLREGARMARPLPNALGDAASDKSLPQLEVDRLIKDGRAFAQSLDEFLCILENIQSQKD